MDENEILAKVARLFGVSEEILKSRKRTQHVAFVRHVASYLIREHTDLSYPAIGELLGRDHSTIIHGHNLIAKRMVHDRAFVNTITTVEAGMQARVARLVGGRRRNTPVIAWENRNDFERGCMA